MPTVETTSPIEVEVNVTTESPTLNLQIDGYLKSEIFVVNIAYKLVPSGGFTPGTYHWKMSATANEIADAVSRKKKIVGHRVTSGSVQILNGYVECLFSGVGGIDPVSATFKEITSTGITSYTVYGDNNVARVETVPFSSGGGISSLLVTFSESGGVWTADKTFAEVTAAIADGAYVYATDELNMFFTLTDCDPRPNDGAVTFMSAGDPIYGYVLFHNEVVYDFSYSFATQTWVQSQGYLTQHQSLDNYQTKSITDAGGYYTTDTVDGALQEIGAELAGINTLIGSGVIT